MRKIEEALTYGDNSLHRGHIAQVTHALSEDLNVGLTQFDDKN